MKGREQLSKRKIISVILISAGIGILLFVVGSYVFNSIKVSIESNNFDSLASTIVTTEETTTNSSDSSDETQASDKNQGNNESPESINNGNVKIDAEGLYKGCLAYNENLKSTQSNKLITEQSYTGSVLDLTKYGIYSNIYGYISAPTIGMELPIYLGANETNMSFGAAQLAYTSLPTGGESTNTVLSGHTGYTGRWLFDDIPNLAVGDSVTIKNYFGNITYKVVEKKIKAPEESEDIYIQKGRDLLTLITCVPDRNGDFNRYIVICER